MPSEPVDVMRMRGATADGHMHTEPRCLTCRPLTREELDRLSGQPSHPNTYPELVERLERIEANQQRLEKALKAHGLGAWAGLA